MENITAFISSNITLEKVTQANGLRFLLMVVKMDFWPNHNTRHQTNLATQFYFCFKKTKFPH